ncbi:MAG: N-formylglutamate amidohydrolase [Desulfobacterales bacterium]
MIYPFVISMPHCASFVPADIRADMALSDEEIRDSKDFGSAEIFQDLPVKKRLQAGYSRLVTDLNRDSANRGPKGVVAETDYRGRQIYLPGRYPDEQSVEERIRKYYDPYHHELARALADPEIRGLFDCHSLNGTGPVDAPDAGKKRKNIILSNNGAPDGGPDSRLEEPTCPAETVALVKSALEAAGFSVAVNVPYRGGFITVHYGRLMSARGGFALQIEMNQDLYMPPGTSEPDPEQLEDVRKRIFSAFETIAKTEVS